MADKPEEQKPNPQMDASRLMLAEQARNAWVVTVEAALTRAQIAHPDFFAHIASKLRPYDRIEVRSDDGTYFAELLVLEAARNYARVHVLTWTDLSTKDVAQSQGAKGDDKAYRVEYKGPHLKWCAIRNSDGGILYEKEESKVAAQARVNDHVRVTT